MIQTVIHVEQSAEYYKAMEEQDWYAVNLYYVPPIYRPWELIKSDMKFEELVMNHEAEMKRIEETPNDILELEIRLKAGLLNKEPKVIKPDIKPRTFLGLPIPIFLLNF